MAARVIQKVGRTMALGVDPHNGLYYLHLYTGQSIPPKPPAVIPGLPNNPQSFHAVLTDTNWVSLDDKSNPTVIGEGKPLISEGHTAKRTIHIPPGGNLAIPLIIGFSSTSWKLAVSSVLASNGPLASTIVGGFGLALDCADPVSLPTAAYWSETTIHLSPTAGDYGAFAIQWAKQAALEIVFAKIASAVADALKPVLRNFASMAARKLGDLLGNKLLQSFGKEAAAEVIAKQAAARAAKETTERMIEYEGVTAPV
ncbi:MAG: hypothetical protein U0414_38205 [Polyangiaceae bacterium]